MSFIDDFDGESGTSVALESHTPSGPGTAWTRQSGSAGAMEVTGSAAISPGYVRGVSASVYTCDDQGSADHVTIARFGPDVNTGHYACVRLVDVDNFVGVRAYGTGSSGLRLTKVVSGSATDLHTRQWADGTWIKIEANGSSIIMSVGGTGATPSWTEVYNDTPSGISTTETSQGLAHTAAVTDRDIFDYFEASSAGGGVSAELTGNSSTAAVGTLGVATEGSVSVTPSGVSATSDVGTLGATAEINASAELTGVFSSGAVGTITAEVGGGATANLSGNESVASVGALGVSTEVNAFVDLLGNSATGAVGTLIVVTGLQVALSGNAATGAVGTLGVTAEVNASAALTGVGSSGAVGTLEITVPITVSVELTGVGATGTIGTLTAVGAGQVWTEIPPVSTIWTEIS